jgi:hypothetical protein
LYKNKRKFWSLFMFNGFKTNYIAFLLTIFITACGGGSDTSGTVTDNIAPEITLVGDNPMTISQGSTFVDPGSIVTDNIDTNLLASVSGTVDSLVIGDYTLTYNVSDAAGNAATAVTRTVSIVDMTAPVITLIGDNPVLVGHGTVFTDLGVTVTDNVDTNLIAEVSGTVDTDIVGNYTLTYSVSASAGNSAIT